MSGLADLAIAAGRAAAQRIPQTLATAARRAQQGRAFLSAVANVMRSSPPTGVADIGRLERGATSSPYDRQLANLQAQIASGLPPEKAVAMLGELDAIANTMALEPGRSPESVQRLESIAALARELESQLHALAEAEIDQRGRADTPNWATDVLRSEQLRATEAGEGGIQHLTPGSSNVYSFMWLPDRKTHIKRSPNPTPESSRGQMGTLFVTFKAWFLKQKKEERRSSNDAGATYAYSGVSRQKYEEFLAHTSDLSGGWAVWEYLRVRGTRSGHQHAYRLIEGQLSPGGGGGTYIPRKATARGYATRTLVSSGGMARSSLSPRSPRPASHVLQPYGRPEPIRSSRYWQGVAAARNREYARQYGGWNYRTGMPDRA